VVHGAQRHFEAVSAEAADGGDIGRDNKLAEKIASICRAARAAQSAARRVRPSGRRLDLADRPECPRHDAHDTARMTKIGVGYNVQLAADTKYKLISSTIGFYTDLSEAQWTVLAPLLPPAKSVGRPRTVSLRSVLDAVFYLLRTGCRLRLLPDCFPQWGTVYHYFRY